MSGSWPNLLLVLVLILINAAFAGTEMAFVSLRKGQLRQLEREGSPRSLRLVRLARDPNRFLATIQIGITQLKSADNFNAGLVMAGTILAIIPTLLLLIFGQRLIVRGLTGGSVK